jgi:hypothetical protein
MALGISLSEMLGRIGHSGDEIIWPHLPEPQRRRTFHVQECAAVALSLGFGVMEYQFGPVLTPDGKSFFDIPVKIDPVKLMSISTGVLLGKGRTAGHAVAWDGKHVYDPHGIVYDIENQSMFTPSSYFLISNQFEVIGKNLRNFC